MNEDTTEIGLNNMVENKSMKAQIMSILYPFFSFSFSF